MKIELNEPSQPKGMEFHVNGLGTLVNGKAVDFSDEEIAAFEEAVGRSVKEAFASAVNIKVTASAKGGDD